VVVLDRGGHPDTARLAHRLDNPSESVLRRLRRDEPALLVLYDVLHLGGHATVDLPYAERRARLEELALDGAAWQTAPSFPAAQAADVRAAARAQGLPSIVAKRVKAPYRPGRHPDWIAAPL
jgi:bifunctional non-homologous end joining protein LigD